MQTLKERPTEIKAKPKEITPQSTIPFFDEVTDFKTFLNKIENSAKRVGLTHEEKKKFLQDRTRGEVRKMVESQIDVGLSFKEI